MSMKRAKTNPILIVCCSNFKIINIWTKWRVTLEEVGGLKTWDLRISNVWTTVHKRLQFLTFFLCFAVFSLRSVHLAAVKQTHESGRAGGRRARKFRLEGSSNYWLPLHNNVMASILFRLPFRMFQTIPKILKCAFNPVHTMSAWRHCQSWRGVNNCLLGVK